MWRELEPARGRFVANCLHDDSAAIQAAAGLKILQVNHSGPLWSWERRRTPSDLRDAFRFYREAARRWNGKVLAFEPWNEADIVDDSGQTGSEMASMQKATYLGLKAGNPQVIVGTIPFAGRTPVTLADYHANQAWPYFDTFNFHVYRDFDEWPATCAPFRDVSAGRPMWITEMNVPIPWPGMQRFRPPTAGDEAAQAERVAKLYAVVLYEGTAAAFYFVLPHYIERNMEHGLLRADLTPRPAYVALAAVGRLLADAHPLGKLRTDHPRLRGFIFRARPDGTERVVVVAWATDRAETLELPVSPIATYDVLGRSLPTSDTVELSTAPVIMVFGPDSAKLRMEPPPAAPQRLEGKPSPVVLQVVVPKQRIDGRSRPTPSGGASLTASRSTSTILGPKRSQAALRSMAPKTGTSHCRNPFRRRPATELDWASRWTCPKRPRESRQSQSRATFVRPARPSCRSDFYRRRDNESFKVLFRLGCMVRNHCGKCGLGSGSRDTETLGRPSGQCVFGRRTGRH